MIHSFTEISHHLHCPLKLHIQVATILLLLISGLKVSPQETYEPINFSLQPGFNIEQFTIERCKTYYDSTTHILFNPCFDFRNRGIYSSYFARSNILGNCISCDSVLVLIPRMEEDIDWEKLNRQQKETWDYYLKLWQKQDKLERYYIDLEGMVKGAKTGPIK